MATRKLSHAAQIAQIIASATVLDLSQLVQELGFSRDVTMLAALVAKYQDEAEEEPGLYLQPVTYWGNQEYMPNILGDGTVESGSEGTTRPSPIQYVKAIRIATGMRLAEAKRIVDKASAQTIDANKLSKRSLIIAGSDERISELSEKLTQYGVPTVIVMD